MDMNITIEVWEKKNWYIARCPELDFVSQGKTRDEAKKNLLEVIQIQFQEMSEAGNLGDYLTECGYEKSNNVFNSQTQMVDLEKQSVQFV